MQSWFSIQPPQPSFFDKDNNIIVSTETLGYDLAESKEKKGADGKEERLYCNLRKMAKMVGEETTQNLKST